MLNHCDVWKSRCNNVFFFFFLLQYNREAIEAKVRFGL